MNNLSPHNLSTPRPLTPQELRGLPKPVPSPRPPLDWELLTRPVI